MLDLMSLEERIDSRVALLMRHRIEMADPDALDNIESDLRDLLGGRIPREIWQQRHLQPGRTLMSPVGRFSVDTLNGFLKQRSKSIHGPKNPDVFAFQKCLEEWLADNMAELEYNFLQAGGDQSDICPNPSVAQRHYSHLDVATS
jgi:hypothetical protein